MCTAKGAQTKCFVLLRLPPFFHLLAKSCIISLLFYFFLFSDKPHNYPSVPDLGTAGKAHSICKAGSSTVFPGRRRGEPVHGFVWAAENFIWAMPQCTVTPTCAIGKESTEQVLGPIFIDHYVAVLKREAERQCERNLGWTEGNFISGFCYLSNIK